MELSLRASLEADVEDEGAAVVPGRLLMDIARLLPAGEVALEHRADEGVVRIECGPAQYRVNTYSVEDFPRLPDLEQLPRFTVDTTRFWRRSRECRRLARRVSAGADRDPRALRGQSS